MPTTTEYFFYLCALHDEGYDDLDTDPVEHYSDLSSAPADHNYIHNGYIGYPEGTVACYDYRDKSHTIAVFTAAPSVAPGEEVVGEEAFLAELVNNCGFDPETTIVDGLPVEPPLMVT